MKSQYVVYRIGDCKIALEVRVNKRDSIRLFFELAAVFGSRDNVEVDCTIF